MGLDTDVIVTFDVSTMVVQANNWHSHHEFFHTYQPSRFLGIIPIFAFQSRTPDLCTKNPEKIFAYLCETNYIHYI